MTTENNQPKIEVNLDVINGQPTPEQLRNIILNAHQPYVIKNMKLNWPCFGGISLKDWLNKFDENNTNNTKFNFDICNLKHSHEPQWEKYWTNQRMSMNEFYEKYKINKNTDGGAPLDVVNTEISSATATEFENQSNPINNWASFSYKRFMDFPKKLSKGITFSPFGFDNISDITFWLGSKGNNTPCHFDTYGCNIVVQVFGRKSWMLFPPGTTVLEQTRVPYEESSVYCKENFYSPNDLTTKFKAASECAYHVILEPGDILIMPNKWWHYAENLEISFSINTWILFNSDIKLQMEEFIFKNELQTIVSGLSKDVIRQLVYKMDAQDFEDVDLSIVSAFNNLLSLYMHMDDTHDSKDEYYRRNTLTEKELENLLVKTKNYVSPIKNISSDEFYKILQVNALRYDQHLEMHLANNSDVIKEKTSEINTLYNSGHVQIIVNHEIQMETKKLANRRYGLD